MGVEGFFLWDWCRGRPLGALCVFVGPQHKRVEGKRGVTHRIGAWHGALYSKPACRVGDNSRAIGVKPPPPSSLGNRERTSQPDMLNRPLQPRSLSTLPSFPWRAAPSLSSARPTSYSPLTTTQHRQHLNQPTHPPPGRNNVSC
jgi:hypothetical protein